MLEREELPLLPKLRVVGWPVPVPPPVRRRERVYEVQQLLSVVYVYEEPHEFPPPLDGPSERP